MMSLSEGEAGIDSFLVLEQIVSMVEKATIPT